NAPKNSGPSYMVIPNNTAVYNKNTRINIGAADTVNHDILYFELSNVLNNKNSLESYNSGYDSTHPITPYCPPGNIKDCLPVPTGPFPRGVFFDNSNADFVFTPTKINESSAISTRIKEYRMINGVKTLIGTFMSEFLLNIKSSSSDNYPLTLKVNKKHIVKANEILKVPFSGYDNDSSKTFVDSVGLLCSKGIEKGTFKIAKSGKRPEGEFTWTPDCSFARAEPYHFTVSAFNKNGLFISEDVAVTVLPPDLLREDTALCTPFSLKLKSKLTGRYKWSTGVNDTLSSITITTPGKYSLSYVNRTCKSFDSVFVYEDLAKPNVFIGNDTLICDQNPALPVTFKIEAINKFYVFDWKSLTGKSMLNTFSTADSGKVLVSVNNACGSAFDTLRIERLSSPPVFKLKDSVFCSPFKYTIGIAKKPFVNYIWNNGSNLSTIDVKSKGNYILTAYNKCATLKDTASIDTIAVPEIFAGNDTTLCNSASLLIIPKGNFTSYKWTNGVDILQVNAGGTYIVKGSNSCKSAFDTIVVIANNIPTPNLGRDRAICGPTLLDASSFDADYLSNDATEIKNKLAETSGHYFLKVSNFCGTVSDTVNLTLKSKPIVQLGPDLTFADTFTTILNAGNPGSKYRWLTSPADTFQTLTIHSYGTYTVRVYNECGQDIASIKISQATVGITSPELKALYLFPNPSRGFVTIGNIPEGVNLNNVTINSMDGKTFNAQINSAGEIDLRTISSGIYILKINTDKGIAEFKVVLEK
ncbi:MAG: T9SS type A sorting domain-containing protein, partial [Bacteroidia bacterium]|nr:T9SS type A sorting domain-containing protein [Bacteroidia bacterium]